VASDDSTTLAILYSNRAAALLGVADEQEAKLKGRADRGSIAFTHGMQNTAEV